MDNIKLGTMLSGAQKFNDQNINPTWKSSIVLEDKSIVSAYVKIIPMRKIIVECICAILGQFLKLPIPEPVITLITHDSLPNIVPINKYKIAFGSIDSNFPSLRRYVNDPIVMDKLKNIKLKKEIGTFDEWIGNWDRNIGNMLYGGNNDFVFIDHENALNENLKPDDLARLNQLLNYITANYTESQKLTLLDEIKKDIFPEIVKIPIDKLKENFTENIIEEKHIEDITIFLKERIVNLYDLLSERLEIPQKGLALC